MKAFGMIIPALFIAVAMVIGAAALLAPANETNAATGIYFFDVDGSSINTDDLNGGIGVNVIELYSDADFGGSDPSYELDGTVGDGWYMVMNDISLCNITNDSEIAIIGNVNLIIGVNCTLTLDIGIYLSTSGSNFYLWSEDNTGGGNIGELVQTNSGGSAIHVYYGDTVTNTAYVKGDFCGIYSDRYCEVTNGKTGIVEGGLAGVGSMAIGGGVVTNYGSIAGIGTDAYGVPFSGFGEVYNHGEIKGNGDYPSVLLGGGGRVVNYDSGTIKGSKFGISLESNSGSNDILNYGSIEGDNTGVFVEYSASIENTNGSYIGGATGIFIGDFDGANHQFRNNGKIEGTSGIGIHIADGNCTMYQIENSGDVICDNAAVYISSGSDMEVYNSGSITSAFDYGVQFGTGASGGILTNSSTGSISGDIAGVFFVGSGILFNYGEIASAQDGVYAGSTIEIENHGLITGEIRAIGVANLLNDGIVDGTVRLGNYANVVTFRAGSSITGDFIMGTGAGTKLDFRGTPTGSPLKYSTVSGTANIGNAAVTLDSIPAAYAGGTIVLIDSATSVISSQGYYVGVSTTTTASVKTFQILAPAMMLIAAGISNYNYIDITGTTATHQAIGIDQVFFGGATSFTLRDYPGVTTGPGTWYFVIGDSSVTDITTVGDVKLIIGRNVTLTVTNGVTVTSPNPFGLYSEPFTPPNNRGKLLSNAAGASAITLSLSNFENTASVIATGAGSYGISSSNAAVTNNGDISGVDRGIYATTSVKVDNRASGVITGITAVHISYFNGAVHSFVNEGSIDGSTYGIYINDGSNFTITNRSPGLIWGGSIGIGVSDGTGTHIINDGGSISGGYVGVTLNVYGVVDNLLNGAAIGEIKGNISYGVYFNNQGGEAYNYGKITGGERGINASGNGFLTVYNDGDGTTTGIVQGTSEYGIYAGGPAYIANYNDGLISGAGGIYVAYLDFNNGSAIEIYGGTIKADTAGWFGIYVVDGDGVGIYNNGKIDATGVGSNGIFVNYGNEVYVYNDVAGVIDSGNAGIWVVDSDTTNIWNYGSIDAAYGISATANYLYVCNGGTITATDVGIETGGDPGLVENYGIITSTMVGIGLTTGGTVYNNGEITGGDYGIYSGGDAWVKNEGDGVNDGIIEGTNEWGIYSEEAVYVNNDGGLITGNGGIYAAWLDEASGFEIINSGTIKSTSKGGINVNDGLQVKITNSGLIESDMNKAGIYVNHGDTVYIDNTAAGTVKALNWAPIMVWAADTSVYIINSGAIEAEYGIEVYSCDDTLVINDGTINNSLTGIYCDRYATVVNNGTITAGSPGSGWGISLNEGGDITNNGDITSTVYGIEVNGGPTTLVNWGIITGEVKLTNEVNRVTLGSGSKIDGDFYIGTDPATTLYFEGALDPSLTYAEITGDSDIGNKTAKVSFDLAGAGLPAYFPLGEKIILIDGSAGSIVTAPANDFLLFGYIYFKVYVKDNQLIAERAKPVVNYYITATADSNTTISPAGTSTVTGGSNATFTFSAAAGSFIGSVAVDGVYLSQADIDKGYYTFYDVKANHTIKVESRGSRTGISLTVTVAEGKGFAEYSVNGGNFAKYTSSVPLPEGSNVTLRAVASKGFEFVEWREGGTITPVAEVTFNNVSSSVDASLSFSGSDSSGISGSNLLMYAAIVIVILLVVIVIVFLLRRPKATA